MGVAHNTMIVLMGFFVTASCGLVGNYLILRRMALVGDAISHSVLAGIAGVIVFTGHLHVFGLFIGALISGVLTAVLIEVIHRYSRVKQDAAIGITFTSLFALGVILISQQAGDVHIDEECVLYGEIVFVPLDLTKLTVAPAFASALKHLPGAEVHDRSSTGIGYRCNSNGDRHGAGGAVDLGLL